MNVRDLMTPSPSNCRPFDSLDAPARLMWDHDCGFVPVVNLEMEVVGVVTDRDICMAGLMQGVPLQRIPVETAMSKQVFSCKASDGIDVAERLMREHRVRRLPVVGDNDELVGVLSLNDLANKGASAPGVASTFAAVSAPRTALAAR